MGGLRVAMIAPPWGVVPPQGYGGIELVIALLMRELERAATRSCSLREALRQHVSQVTRMRDNPQWRVLADVSAGEWLDVLFQDYEFFHRRILRTV